MDSEIRFWYGLGGGGLGSNGAYSNWIQHAAWQRALVTGETSLFQQTSADGESGETLLELMAKEFDAKERQTRLDWCEIALQWPMPTENRHQFAVDLNRPTIDDRENKIPHSPDLPHCYSILDGWDAMEGSISGGGCRPSNNAMFFGNALAIAELATATGDTVRILTLSSPESSPSPHPILT